MKIKAVVVSVFIFFVQVLGGCSFFSNADNEADLALLKEAAETISLPETAESDITFPKLAEKYNSVTLAYKSDNTKVISSNGSVLRGDEDVYVKITAQLKLNKSEHEKNFNILVLKIKENAPPEEENPTEKELSLTVSAAALIKTESSDRVSVNLKLAGKMLYGETAEERAVKLKTSYQNGSSLAEKVYNSGLDSAGDGSFSFDIPLEEYLFPTEKTIALKLILSEPDSDDIESDISSDSCAAAEYGINKDATDVNYFMLTEYNQILALKTELKTNPSDIAVSAKIRLLSDSARLNIIMSGKNLTALTSDVQLPEIIAGGYGSGVLWSSNNPQTLSAGGKISRPWVGLADISLSLSATVSLGALTLTKAFPAKVLATTSAKTFSGVQVYRTTNADSFTKLSDGAFISGSASGTIIDVDSSVTYNEIEGAGGMLSHGTAYLLRNTTTQKRAQILEEFFSPDGAGFSVIRLPIGASDFPTYVGAAYDSSGNRVQDGILKNFSLCDTKGPAGNLLQDFNIDVDLQELIPIIKEIQSINPDVVFSAAPWTAPAWMKTSNNLCGGWLMGPNDATNYESTYCDYLIKYIEEYAALGIKINYLSLQNEPDHQDTTYPTMQMHYDTQKRMAKELDTKFKSKGLDTKIIILDHNTDLSTYATNIISDSLSKGYADRIGVGVHGYSPTMTTANEYETFINSIRAVNPDIEFYFTEMTAGNSGSAVGNLNWAMKNILMPSYNLGAKFTMYFNFVLDQNGMPFIRTDWIAQNYNCIGLVELNTSGSIKYNPEFYALKHLSKFAGAITVNGKLALARRLKATINNTSDNNFTYTATMRADGLISVVAHNQNSSSKTITLRHGGKVLQYSLAANSVTTFTWYI